MKENGRRRAQLAINYNLLRAAIRKIIFRVFYLVISSETRCSEHNKAHDLGEK